jgi:ribosomal protein L31E
MPKVGFEPTIPVFERAKTVQALDRAATVIGEVKMMIMMMMRITTIIISLA